MSDWSAGYIADLGYTYGYYSELNPLKVRLAFLNSGLVYPKVVNACELGFGQGLSANLHASASVAKWYGTDFNPSQAAFAQEISQVSSNNAQLFDESFSEFSARSDLPQFDYIGLHGIWSWISDENRSTIVEFIRRKLKVGGVLYISYNTLPGWAAFAPVRHLMVEHAEVIGSEGRGIVSRIDDAVDFADRLLAINPLFSRANPLVAERIKNLKEQNKHYLAHEYFNRDWHPMHFATMVEWLEPAKLQYACSAHYTDQIDLMNVSTEQQIFLKQIPDRMFRESVRDFVVNQQFRRDYWVKGLRTLSSAEKTDLLKSERVILVRPRMDVSLKANGALGEITMTEAIYNPILDNLSDHRPRSLMEIAVATQPHGVRFTQVVQAILVLAGKGAIASVQDESDIEQARESTQRLNAHLLSKARLGSELNYLASPLTGGGIPVNHFQQLFLLSYTKNGSQSGEWANDAWNILSEQNQKLIKEGKTLDTVEENIEELRSQAAEFKDKYFPILKALLVID